MPAVQYTIHHEPEITFTPDKSLIVYGGEEVHLEPLQSKLLHYFIENQGEVLTTQAIAENVWERAQVSDNLVRQVISQLRGQLKDKVRPYQIISTIPKKGYVLSPEVVKFVRTPDTQSISPEPEGAQPANSQSVPPPIVNQPLSPASETVASALRPAQPKTFFSLKVIALVVIIILLVVGGVSIGLYHSEQNHNPSSRYISHSEMATVFLHQITLHKSADYDIAESVNNYLFYGLNASRSITAYKFSHLEPGTEEKGQTAGYEIKSLIRDFGDQYELTVYLQGIHSTDVNEKIEKTFTKKNFISAIGEVVLELKTIISPTGPDDSVVDHNVTSVTNYEDWSVISSGISLLMHGEGGTSLQTMVNKLNVIKQEGRNSYLVDGLLSYAASMNYLQTGSEQEKSSALTLAQSAFNKEPRCDIANVTLGLALLLNNHSDRAYPYLFYAGKSAPSAISFYLLSVADELSHNPRGSAQYYRRYTEIKKENAGEFFELMKPSQKTNLLQKPKI